MRTQRHWNLFAALNCVTHPSRTARFPSRMGKKAARNDSSITQKLMPFFHEKVRTKAGGWVEAGTADVFRLKGLGNFKVSAVLQQYHQQA